LASSASASTRCSKPSIASGGGDRSGLGSIAAIAAHAIAQQPALADIIGYDHPRAHGDDRVGVDLVSS
jgi:hypothetical protein